MPNKILWIESGSDNLVYSGYYRDFLRREHQIDPVVAGCMSDLVQKLSFPYTLIFLNPYNFRLAPIKRINERLLSGNQELYENGIKALHLIRETTSNKNTPVFLFDNDLDQHSDKTFLKTLERDISLSYVIDLTKREPKNLVRLVLGVSVVRALSFL